MIFGLIDIPSRISVRITHALDSEQLFWIIVIVVFVGVVVLVRAKKAKK